METPYVLLAGIPGFALATGGYPIKDCLAVGGEGPDLDMDVAETAIAFTE